MPPEGRQGFALDTALAVAAALAAGAATLVLFRSLDPRLLAWPAGNDVWFEGDLPAVFRNLLNRFSDQTRNGDHPLFPLFATVPVTALHHAGLSAHGAVGAFLSAVAGAWAALLFTALRLLHLRRPDALILTAAGCSTASAIFWLPVPESAGLGSVTILAILIAAALSDRRPLPEAAVAAASAFSLSVTVTHWFAGLLLAAARLAPRRALQVSVNAFALVVLLWSVQRAIVPSAEFFIGYTAHAKFILHPDAGGPRAVVTTLLVHSAVMPRPAVRHEPKWGDVLSIQHAGLRPAGAAAVAATAAWAALLLLGAAAMRLAGRTVRIVAPGALGGQLVLHLLYGEESFLYALSTVPLLLVVAAHAARTRLRPAVLLLALVFIASAAPLNLARFREAARFMEQRADIPRPPAQPGDERPE